MINFPQIDPVAFSIASLEVRWYGIAYAIGFLVAMYNAKFLCRVHFNTPIKERHIDDLFTYGILGVILGGRLGYVLFYNLDFYLTHPENIIKIWQGGMSFHGGLVGVLIAIWAYSKKEGTSFFYLTDRIAPGACLGLMFGRLANFINSELWGRPTDLPWGMIFPAADAQVRHPSQLYEALFEGAILFIILFFVAKRQNIRGVVSSLFAIGYGTFRFFLEYTREPDDIAFLHTGIFEHITMGQLLSIPMVIFGSVFLYKIIKDRIEYDRNLKNTIQAHRDEVSSEIKEKDKKKKAKR